MRRTLRRWKDFEMNVEKIRTLVKEGSPARAILETIDEEDIDLVVMGSSGKSGIDRFLMGSVAEKVVKSAKCCVLLIH